MNMLAVADGRPETLSLQKILEYHIDFQFEVTTRKYKNMLDKEQKKCEVQEGLIRACDVIDLIIEVLRGSRSREQVKDCLVKGVTEGIRFKTEKSKKAAAKLRFTEMQANAILDMRLYKLIGLEIDVLMKEHEETLKNIARYTDILNNYGSMAEVIIKELDQFKKEFGRPRRTMLENAGEVVLEEQKIEAMPVVFLMDRFGYVRTIDESVYERNKEAADAENRYVLHCMNTDRVMIFTDTGKVHLLKLIDVPYGRFRDKGTPARQPLQLLKQRRAVRDRHGDERHQGYRPDLRHEAGNGQACGGQRVRCRLQTHDPGDQAAGGRYRARRPRRFRAGPHRPGFREQLLPAASRFPRSRSRKRPRSVCAA